MPKIGKFLIPKFENQYSHKFYFEWKKPILSNFPLKISLSLSRGKNLA